MKFSLVAILPAVLWTVFWLVVLHPSVSYKPGNWADVMLVMVYFFTASVLALYWASRIVRLALRGPQR